MNRGDEMEEPGTAPQSRPKRVDTSRISRNKENPRLIFDPDSLAELKESIRKVGILVPLIVFKDETGDNYTLLDGERRWICAMELGLPQVPVNEIERPTPLQNILRMFNIHNVQKQWSSIEAALKIEKLSELTEDKRAITLSQLTGLKPGQIRRYRQILKLTGKGRGAMLEFVRSGGGRGEKASIMEEMLPVLRIIERDYPGLWSDYDYGNRLIDLFILKYKQGAIGNVTQMRKLRKVLLSARKGVDIEDITIGFRDFMRSEGASIDELYKKIAKPAYDFKLVIDECERIADTLYDIDIQRLGEDERKRLCETLVSLEKQVSSIRNSLGGS